MSISGSSYWVYLGEGMPQDGPPLVRLCYLYPRPEGDGWFWYNGGDGFNIDGVRDPNWTPPEEEPDWSLRYWVAGSGNWSDTNHWSLWREGYPNSDYRDRGEKLVGYTAPITGQDAIFQPDSNLSAPYTVTLDQNVTCDSIQIGSVSGCPSNYPRFDFNGKTVTCLAGGIVLMSPEQSSLDIAGATIYANQFVVTGYDVSSAGSEIHLVCGDRDEYGGNAVLWSDFAAYHDLVLDYVGRNNSIIQIIFPGSFNNITVAAQNNMVGYLSILTYDDVLEQQYPMSCASWGVTGSMANNFHIIIDTAYYTEEWY